MSGYDWATEILVWGYASAGGRRPLFRVWGYAPDPESVISQQYFHTILPWDLDRKSTTEHLVAYITTHHESLVALLPPDTTCADLFGEVENQRPIASFLSASQDAAIGR